MNTQTLLHLFLALHIIALIMTVGVTVTNTFASRQFWKFYDADPQQGLAGFKGLRKLQPIGGIGLLLLIISGIAMLGLYNWAYGPQLWFKVKMICLILIFVNGFSLGRITTSKLGKLIDQDQPGELNIARLRKNLNLFHTIQLTLFAIIIVMASFRFV